MTTTRSVPARRRAALAAGAAALALVSLAPAVPVAALDQANNSIRVTENQTVEKSYGPMGSMEPLPVGLPSPAPKLNSPERCRQVTYCDVVPLEIVLPPTLRPSDEFFVSVALDWKTQTLPAVSVPGKDVTRPADFNDLDLYVWADPAAGQPADDHPAGQSATASRPEKVRLFRPTKVKYSIVVFNYQGANTGYTLRVDYRPEAIVPPFESLAPTYNPPAPPADTPLTPVEEPEPAGTPPVETPAPPAGPPTAAPASPPGVQAASPLTPVAVEPDPDFSNFADDAFDRQLAAPSTDVLQEKQAKAVGPPPPASTSTLVFWLAIVPLLLVAGAGFWLSRKGSAVLKLGR
ncbi:MAG TPA: hypothetical protein VHL53_11700 [Acidimicrobiia bacterium]|nr:hypothetical protein [Acidimicrobiia bacterium]